MRGAATALLLTVLLALLLALLLGFATARARAQASEAPQARVAVDWSAVSDADVARCGLGRLRAGTIERLVGAGHAVVESTDASGVRVTVASVPGALGVRVDGPGHTREERLELGASCDATFALEVIARIAELVDEVARASAAQAAAAPTAAQTELPAATSEVAPPRASRSALQAALDATLRVNESPDYQLGGGFSARARFPAGWEAGARLELTGHAAHGVTALEAFLGLTCAYQPDLPGLGPYLELGPILHHAGSDALAVTELDAALAAGIQLALGHFLAQLGVYGRLRSFEHHVGAQPAFDTGRVGLLLRLGAQLSDS